MAKMKGKMPGGMMMDSEMMMGGSKSKKGKPAGKKAGKGKAKKGR